MSATVFVYYHDDHEEMSGHGLEVFTDKDLHSNGICPRDRAQQFIEDRMLRKGVFANIEDYMVIEGKELTLSAVQTVTKINLT